jgi:hypothetical protein
MKIKTLFPKPYFASILLSAMTLIVIDSTQPANSANSNYYQFDDKGELIRPTGYREWVFVGTPLTPNDMNDGKAPFPEFHAVYIDPDSWTHWKKTGKFREGTILMKELISVGSKAAVSGKGYFMGEFLGLEATIKSSERFPDEPGNWAYFSFTIGEPPMMSPDKPVRGGPGPANVCARRSSHSSLNLLLLLYPSTSDSYRTHFRGSRCSPNRRNPGSRFPRAGRVA